MQARRRHRAKTIRRTARRGAARRGFSCRKAALCGLFCCLFALSVLARACAGPGQGALPESLTFPLVGEGWSLSSGYGWRADPLTGERSFHEGVDLACAEGTPVVAALDGVVSASRRSESYGNCILLSHPDGVETLYAHLQYLFVRPGEVVQAGQVLGSAGSTGWATGAHLHFELLCDGSPCDPSALLDVGEESP